MEAEQTEERRNHNTSRSLFDDSQNARVQMVRRVPPASASKVSSADEFVKPFPRSTSHSLSKSSSYSSFRGSRSNSSFGPPEDTSLSLPKPNYRTASRETQGNSLSDSPKLPSGEETNKNPAALPAIITQGTRSSSTVRRRGLIFGSTAEELDFVERDQYGFDKASDHVSPEATHDFERIYAPILARRKAKWDQLLKETGGVLPPPSMKVKRYIRKGIPSNIRGKCWLHYSGAETLMQQNIGLYQDIVLRTESNEGDLLAYEIIERDLHRTFPENIKFKSKKTSENGTTVGVTTDNVPAIQSLRRVLRAFALHVPSVGYCQSLNYICGLLLLFMTEEEVFWTLTNIVQNMLPEGVYGLTMEGATIDQEVLMELLSERVPEVAEKLGYGTTEDVPTPTTGIVQRYRSQKAKARVKGVKEESTMPPISLVTSNWFLTLYINILPVETVLRVWDAFFYEGDKVLFRVALSLFKLHEAAILEIKEPLEIFQYVQNMPKRMVNCHLIMEHCFVSVAASLSRKEIRNLRNTCRRRRRKKMILKAIDRAQTNREII